MTNRALRSNSEIKARIVQKNRAALMIERREGALHRLGSVTQRKGARSADFLPPKAAKHSFLTELERRPDCIVHIREKQGVAQFSGQRPSRLDLSISRNRERGLWKCHT